MDIPEDDEDDISSDSSDFINHVKGNSLKSPASTTYAHMFAPHHNWAIGKVVVAGMYALPTKAQLLTKLNEDAPEVVEKLGDSALSRLKMLYTQAKDLSESEVRKQKSAFDNTIEKEDAPIPLTREQVFQRVQHLRGDVFGKTQRPLRWKKGEARPIWKKVFIFFQLEYWKFFPVRHVLDMMHIDKNICEALLGTFLNIPGKKKDRESVRLDMAEMGIRTELRPKNPVKKEKASLA
ncbi:hypothetical protein AgCh_025543 [Apium graveolens]